MKKTTKLIVTLICLLIAICFYSNYSFASSKKKDTIKKEYEEYVNKTMIPKYGKIKNIAKLNDGLDTWQDQIGIITTYTADINNDGKKECIVLYIDEEVLDKEGSEEKDLEDADQITLDTKYTSLHMAILSKQKNKIVESDNITLVSDFNRRPSFNYKFYIKTNKNKKYIIMHGFCDIELGGANDLYIMGVTDNNTLFLEEGLTDPGYSSGLGLYRLNTSIDTLTDNDYYHTGTVLYDSESCINAVECSTYKKKLQSEIKKYGLKLKIDTIYSSEGTKQYMLKKDSTLKCFCTMLSV